MMHPLLHALHIYIYNTARDHPYSFVNLFDLITRDLKIHLNCNQLFSPSLIILSLFYHETRFNLPSHISADIWIRPTLDPKSV